MKGATATGDVAARRALDGAGLRKTAERVAVLTYLMTHRGVHDVDMLAERFSGDVHRVTLYRMLEQLVECGLIERTVTASDKRSYEYQHSHHHHVTCVRCGDSVSVTVAERRLIDDVRRCAPGYTVTSHIVEFQGVCPSCRSC